MSKPAKTIWVICRTAQSLKTWRTRGHLLFQMFGEHFAATEIREAQPTDKHQWCVTHVSTGARVPKSEAVTPRIAVMLAKAFLKKQGKARLQDAIMDANEMIGASKIFP